MTTITDGWTGGIRFAACCITRRVDTIRSGRRLMCWPSLSRGRSTGHFMAALVVVSVALTSLCGSVPRAPEPPEDDA